MKNKLTIILMALAITFSLKAFAQDSDDDKYEAEKEECYQVADETANDENWEKIYNDCLKRKGVKEEQGDNSGY